MERKLALGLLLLLQVAVLGVAGHGYMCSPAARNAVVLCGYPEFPVRNWNENEQRAGGPQVVYQGSRYPNGNHGACGDPSYESPGAHMKGGWLYTGFNTATYRPGQRVKMEIVTSYHHKGFFDWSICKLEGDNDVTQSCLDQRPVALPNGNYRWWLPYGEPATTWTYYMEIQLPGDLECDHCVLAWHYHTANACNPPGIPPEALALPNSNMFECGGPTDSKPEEFWNCADIRITSDPSATITQGPSNAITPALATDKPPSMRGASPPLTPPPTTPPPTTPSPTTPAPTTPPPTTPSPTTPSPTTPSPTTPAPTTPGPTPPPPTSTPSEAPNTPSPTSGESREEPTDNQPGGRHTCCTGKPDGRWRDSADKTCRSWCECHLSKVRYVGTCSQEKYMDNSQQLCSDPSDSNTCPSANSRRLASYVLGSAVIGVELA